MRACNYVIKDKSNKPIWIASVGKYGYTLTLCWKYAKEWKTQTGAQKAFEKICNIISSAELVLAVRPRGL